jgi:hypothetical protein
MPYRFSFVILLIFFGVTACAGRHGAHQEGQELFSTEIHSDGSKRFILALLYQQDKDGRPRSKGKPEGKRDRGGDRKRQGQSGRGRPDSEQNSSQGSTLQRSEAGYDEDKREAIMDLLDQKLIETGFCRHGFIELDYSQMRDTTELVGECQESASEEDIQRWGS